MLNENKARQGTGEVKKKNPRLFDIEDMGPEKKKAAPVPMKKSTSIGAEEQKQPLPGDTEKATKSQPAKRTAAVPAEALKQKPIKAEFVTKEKDHPVKKQTQKPSKARTVSDKAAAKKEPAPRKIKEKKPKKAFYDQSRALYRAMPIVLAVSAVVCAICLAVGTFAESKGGIIGKWLIYGGGALFSVGIYTIPALLALGAVMWRRDIRHRRAIGRIIYSLLVPVIVGAIYHAASSELVGMSYDAVELLREGTVLRGGGFFGGSVAWLLHQAVGKVCMWVLLVLASAGYLCTVVGIKDIRRWHKAHAEKKAEKEKNKDSVPERLPFFARIRLKKQTGGRGDGYFADAPDEEDFQAIKHRYEEEQRIAREQEEIERLRLEAEEKERMLRESLGAEEAEQRQKRGMLGGLFHKAQDSDGGKRSRQLYDHEADQATPTELMRGVQPAADAADLHASAAEGMPVQQNKQNPAPVIKGYQLPKAAKGNAYGSDGTYMYPPADLLISGKAAVIDTEAQQEIEHNSATLIDTLDSFNVKTHMVGTSRGPRITRYELMPEKGVKISSIIARVDDIALNLASAGIRIEAPIPGVAAVGVEVPNKKSTLVRIKDLLTSEAFINEKSKTTICLGSDVTGKPVFADVAKMPHLLIAGATGMGKSVCINAVLLSLLYKARPDEVKLILVDPKKVELNIYNNIPHLLIPVVTEPQAAAGALIWAVGEMERRFELIEAAGVRDITAYNKSVTTAGRGEMLPKIIIIIDELNDLMMSARDAVEASICRIAQKARAAGMHLIIGTQRPSVDVITGLIKANIPSRIAFHVSSQVDSRTVLDTAGAEKLLSHGDMLAALVGKEPIRVQGSMVEDDEVERVTTFLKDNARASGVTYDSNVMEEINRETEKYRQSNTKKGDRGGEEEHEEFDDDIFNDQKFRQVAKLAVDNGKLSTSLIQRKLSIGYGRAAKYVDILESMGVVGPQDGSKPRDVLMSWEQFMELEMRNNNGGTEE